MGTPSARCRRRISAQSSTFSTLQIIKGGQFCRSTWGVILAGATTGVAVLSVNVDIEIVRVDAQCTATGAACPGCDAWSTQVHSFYLRFPADVPSAGRSVVLQLRVRRFRCGNAMCPRRTFVEQIPGLTRRHGQRTELLRHTGCGRSRPGGPSRRPPGLRPWVIRQSEHGLAPD
ncbi:transposase family protein [Streptomyces sp. NBC_01707]|uniref:transposase family protein n=1 Tax=unclassified Streptomyces TaxID=2593676 RepID=UPI002E0F4E87|nr:transposase family protein [Streptomyces sp. NBC_01230]